MNWTGGRLHRSSYKMKSSAKHIGKQRVAQAKTQVLDRYGDAVSPKVAAVVIGREKSCDDGPPSTIGVLCASTHKGKRSTSPYIEGLRRKRCRHYQILDSPSVGVDEMRKKLLDKKDWACLSPSRPYRLPIGRDHDAGQVEKRQSLLHMSSPSRCVPQQDLPSLPTKGQKTKTVYPYPTQLRSDDIEVWIEQKKGVTQPETPYTRKHTVTQEFMEPMLSGSNPSGDSANPIHQSDANISQYTSYGIHEQYELGKRAENSPSPDLSGLPILDRRGSFAIVDGQTRYVPPSPCKPPSSGFPGDNGGMGLSRDVIEPYNWRRTGPYHYQRNEAQDVRPKSLEWSEVAGNVTEHSSKYSRGDNSAVVQQREAIHSMEQPRIGCWETPSSDQDPFWPNIFRHR
ncbi:hypothetical protein MGYG_00693 [Nannizzia gypsea CBS 118893]|uniref:Uncharacterized protein n=1 Tax=Arthroderma gypseum (strain ATCC MYA-4604 / CBS 118893) TaxID=535722 RepID=E5R1A3_ARTGP|nr:hypothetical protein MGYG_00693 [Nannizzia gypsea CBS 118893]EFQ97654.1 hypothetical protein MGYG_00693 [Nannizzia gypsea CBS 118893]